jgi:serine/threonine protein kinase
VLFEADEEGGGTVELLRPKRSSLAHRLPGAPPLLVEFITTLLVEFISTLLVVDPNNRPDATQALLHPFLSEIL